MSKHGQFGIRRWADPPSARAGITFWCHGCQSAHSIITEGKGAWQFNGDYDRPVIYPSVRTFYPARKDKETGKVILPERTLCHSWVGTQGAEPGQIIFLGDSSEHALRGVHDLQPWPDYFGFAGEE